MPIQMMTERPYSSETMRELDWGTYDVRGGPVESKTSRELGVASGGDRTLATDGLKPMGVVLVEPAADGGTTETWVLFESWRSPAVGSGEALVIRAVEPAACAAGLAGRDRLNVQSDEFLAAVHADLSAQGRTASALKVSVPAATKLGAGSAAPRLSSASPGPRMRELY